MKLTRIVALLILTASMSTPALSLAQKKKRLSGKQLMAQALAHYQLGEYRSAITKLDQLRQFQNYKGMAYYWKGLVHNKLQKFDDSVRYFGLAQKYKVQPQDFYYELGQAYYASLKLNQAYKAFEKSAAVGFKPDTSFYYMAFIRQTQENYPVAIEDYKRLLALEDKASDDMKQAASFQMAQIYLFQAEKHPKAKTMVQRTVLPELERGLDIDPASKLGKDISKQIAKLESKYDLGPGKMSNGRPIPKKLHLVKFTQNSYYNSNVINEANKALTQVASKGSIVSDSALKMRKRFNFRNTYHVSPDLTLSTRYHLNRNVDKVNRNDNYIINPSVKGGVEHRLFKEPATFISEAAFNYTAQDNRNQNTRIFFGRTYSFGLGEKFKLFGNSETTLMFKGKHFRAYDPNFDTNTFSATYNQTFPIWYGHNLSAYFGFDKNAYKTNTVLDNEIYTFRTDYIIPEVWKSYQVQLGLAYTLTDTKRQNTSRGTEKKINPSGKISRNFMKNKLNVEAHAAYTKQRSNDKENFQFEQYMVGVELSYKL